MTAHRVHYRQGDVPLQALEALPAGFVPVEPDQAGKQVLALGEATGHHHRFENCFAPDNSVRVWRDPMTGEKIVEVIGDAAGGGSLAPAALIHEEHDPIALAPGFYRQLVQVEDDGEMILQVAD